MTKGTVTEALDTVSDDHGWTLVLPGAIKPRRTHYDTLDALLAGLAKE